MSNALKYVVAAAIGIAALAALSQRASAASANITTTGTTYPTTDIAFVSGALVRFNITWTNTGEIAGSFTPTCTINGTSLLPTTYPSVPPLTLAPGATLTLDFAFVPSAVACETTTTYTMIPSPN